MKKKEKNVLENKLFYWVRLDYNLDIEILYSDGEEYKPNSIVIVDTKHGEESGVISVKSVPVSVKKRNISSLQKILRKANEKDIEILEKNNLRKEEIYQIASNKIKKHGLPLKLLYVHNFLYDKKMMFYFYCENRVDFRALVRDLAKTFKVRIELRQIGVRDEAMFMGGYGVCGRPFCCSTFGTNKNPKSIKMAREQNLTLNSSRISGACGRLLCCLDFEYDHYQEDKFTLLEKEREILLNNDTLSKIISIDKERGLLSIRSVKGENFIIPIESVMVDKETMKCVAYI